MESDPMAGCTPNPDGDLRRLPDDELVAAVASGDVESFAELYARYRGTAREHAVELLGSEDESEDLAHEGFVSLLEQLLDGTGRELPFRTGLERSIRGALASCLGTDTVPRSMPSAESRMTERDGESLLHQQTLDLAARAYHSLPLRWRGTIGCLTLDSHPVGSVAARLGVDPVTVAVLGAQAIEALRAAYLRVNTPCRAPRDCRAAVIRIADWICGRLPPRIREQVSRHVVDCPFCTEVAVELREIRARMPTESMPWPISTHQVPAAISSDSPAVT